ncbi:MAG: acyl carrier protein [Bacteroidales bacterium]|nr:acyl carrier protein [Bacteroidales bacterium]
MKKEDFYYELIEYLEIEPVELNEGTALNSIEGYDSMAVMSLIAFCDEKFGKKINAQQIQQLTTVGSLMEFLGKENFEN